LLHLYVFWRAGSVPAVTRRFPRKKVFAAGVVSWASVLLARSLRHSEGSFPELLESLTISWVAALFLMAAALLVVDLLTGFGWLVPRRAPILRGWALLVGGVLSLTAVAQGLRPPVIEEYEVVLPGLPAEMDNTVLVVASDLHLGVLQDAEWLAARAAQIQALQPDLVVLVGDLFEGHGALEEELIPLFGRLAAPLGVYAVSGNHDFYGKAQYRMSLLEKTGVEVLRNSWAEARPGLVIAGVEDLTIAHRAGDTRDLIGMALANRPPEVATIFLSHTPWQLEKAARAGAGLTLCGHTHGGQIWPFDYVVRYFYPLLEGRYDVDGMAVIICRGTGTWGTRMRLWRPNEILRILLRSDSARSQSPGSRDRTAP